MQAIESQLKTATRIQIRKTIQDQIRAIEEAGHEESLHNLFPCC